jgi:hypothetical protein
MKPKPAVIYALVAALLTFPAAVQAQQDAPDMWRAFAQKLDAGTLVGVRTRDGTFVEGHLIQVTNEAVRINPKTRIRVPVREIAFTDIDKIERRRDRWSPGAKVLLGVGIGAGATLLLFLAALSQWD